jgi:hypothetical protein
MRVLRATLILLAVLASSLAFAQGTLLQSGPWTPGNLPVYVGQGSAQPVVQDSGVPIGAATPGSTLCPPGVTPGTYGGVSALPTVTVNANGCVTAIATFPSSSLIGACPPGAPAGAYGDASHYAVFTINGFGCVTAASQVSIGSGTCPSGAPSGAYGDASHYATFTINSFGCVTAAAQVAIASGSCPSGLTPGTYGDAANIPVLTLNGFGCVTAVTTASVTSGLPWAANSDVWTGTSHKVIDAAVALSALAPQTPTPGATLTIDFSQGINFTIQLVHANCPCVIANPLNTIAGISGVLVIEQSVTGNDTVTWGSSWRFPNGVHPTLSTGSNAYDAFPYFCGPFGLTHCVVSTIPNVSP